MITLATAVFTLYEFSKSKIQKQLRLLKQGWQAFSVKGQIVNISGFAGHMLCVTAITSATAGQGTTDDM